MNAPAELALGQAALSRDAGRWILAAVVIFVAHAAFAYALHALTSFKPPFEAEQQALVIDLAPIPISLPESVLSEFVPEKSPPDQMQPVDEPAEIVPEQSDTVAEVDEVEPLDQPEPETPVALEADRLQPDQEVVEPLTPETEEPEPVETEMAIAEPEVVEAIEPEPEVIEPEVEAPTPEVVLPKPKAKKKPAEKKAEPKPRKKVEQQKPRTKPRAKTRQETATAKPSQRSSQTSRASKAPTINPSRWNSAVRAAVARRASSVRGMRGTVRVQFVVSSSGAIVSARVSGSSGDARLDSAALRMVRSARVPRAPEGISGSHTFAIPLTFR